MRNSTAEKDDAPKRKAPGPFRTGAIIPFVIIAALTWAYFHFFFDGHLRRGLEYAGTQAVGAEVNVAEVETSFWHASVVIRGIQVTDASMPTRNMVEIGSIGFQALWDGLLRGKVVIDHADVLDISVLSPRKSPGKVLPPPPETAGVTDQVLAAVKSQYEGNVFGDVAALLEGADPGATIGKLDDNLKSNARIDALKQELPRKQKAWEERLASLPTSGDISALQKRLAKVKLDHFKDLNELRASLKELEGIRDTADGHVKNVQGTSKAVNGELTAWRTAYAEIDQAVKQDVADLQARFRIPQLDTQTVGNVLFGPEMMGKVAKARSYMGQARDYLPPKRTTEEKAALRIQAPPRHEGRNYAFGRPRSYPLFWLKSATITSRSGKGPYSGDLHGKITDVTTDAALVGRPAVLKVEGAFPGLAIYDALLEVVVDRTGDKPMERVTARVGRFPVSGRTLVQGDALTLGFDKASGRTQLLAELKGDAVDLRSVNDFSDVTYQVKAKSSTVQELVSGAVKGVPAINVTARVSGTWSSLKWDLDSNLGAALQQGFARQLEAKVAQARARIEAMVNERIEGERKKLQDQYAAAESSVKQRLTDAQKEVDKLRAELDKAKGQVERQQKSLEKQLKGRVTDQLLKGVLKR